MLASRHLRATYLPPFPDPLTHFRITRGATRRGFEDLPCLLARAWPDGKFEIVNPAWQMLGYPEEELIGRCFCALIALEPDAACAAVKSLLTDGCALGFALRCKDGRELPLYWSRHFDDFTRSMFIIGDEMPAEPPAAKAPATVVAQRSRVLSFHL